MRNTIKWTWYILIFITLILLITFWMDNYETITIIFLWIICIISLGYVVWDIIYKKNN